MHPTSECYLFSLSKEKQGQVKQVENLIPWCTALTDWAVGRGSNIRLNKQPAGCWPCGEEVLIGVTKETLGELDTVAFYQLLQKKFRLEHLMGLCWCILVTLVYGQSSSLT